MKDSDILNGLWRKLSSIQTRKNAGGFCLKRKMSVVGPRSALPNEVAAYNDYQRQRLLVKPGMTCYWQTRRNRDSITFDEWVDLDL